LRLTAEPFPDITAQAIRQLEQKLGVDLLHRTTRAVALTSAGNAFLEQARALVGASRSAEPTARRAGEGVAGQLRIGAVASAFEHPLPDVIADYGQRYPAVSLTLEEIDTHDAADALLTYRLDVTVARIANAPPGLQRRPLRRDRFVLITPASWPRRRANDPAAAASDHPWVWIPRDISPYYHDQVVTCCSSEHLVPSRHHTARSITTQIAMVGAGVGVAVVPASAVPATSTGPVNLHRLRSAAAETATLASTCRDLPDPLVEHFLASLHS
jgi:DNA-binding transcriptional LysR family regulator